MGEKEDIIKGIREFKEKLSKERKIDKIILFGSWATGKQRKNSDIDMIIVSPSFEGIKCGRGAGLHKYWHLDYPVDFLCYTPKEFSVLKKRVSIVSEALKEGIAI
jgi:hypothetical protein